MGPSPYAFAEAKLNRLGASRWRSGHPWIYRSGVEEVVEETGKEAVALVKDPRDRPLGQALLSRESQITLRRITDRRKPVDRDLFRERLARAAALREERMTGREAYRLVFGEADGLPGLVVDRYGPHLVVQFLAWGMDRLREEIVAVLKDVVAPVSILGRNDPGVRELEGLPRVVEALHGETPEKVPYREGRLTFTADLRGGQKTGAFLDQAENHLAAARWAKGNVLDLFTYGGGFGLAAAVGAERVTAVDTSAPALALASRHAELNGLTNVEFVETNAFDYLRTCDREHRRFDTIILDPPAFAKNKRELPGALRGYKEINLRAMKILAPGGILVTCSCSYHLSEAGLDEVLTRAAADAGRAFRVLEHRPQAADHPVRLGFPESQYLKCRILEVMDP